MNEFRYKKKLERLRMRGERQKEIQELKAKYADYYPHREGAKVSNIMLVIIIIAITIYTVASFWLTLVSGVNVDSTLTASFYAFWGSELALLAGIKTSKILKKNKKESCEYEEHDI